jgi:hypothetical protein
MNPRVVPACVDCKFCEGSKCKAVMDVYDGSIVKLDARDVRGNQLLCARQGWWFEAK